MWRDTSFRSALFAFVLTRSIILLFVVLTAQLDIQQVEPGQLPSASLSVRNVELARILNQRATIGDANWYIGIAANGYDHRPFTTERQSNWAFFPLFPLALRAAAKITGEFALTGVALSNIFFFAALMLLHKTALQFGLEPDEASRAVLYLAVFPVSYFFSLPLTESVFLALTTGSFYSAKRGWWWLAGICGALASATRFTGVLLLPALALLYWHTYRTFRPSPKLLALLLIPAGLLSFMYFLYSTTGNPFAFKDILVTWGRHSSFFLTPLFAYLREPLLLATSWDMRLLNFSAVVLAIICGLVLWKWRWWSLAFYVLSTIFVTLSSGLLQSHARYTMVLFPTFMVLARFGRNRSVHQTILTVSLVMLILMTILFCYQVDFALS